MKTLWSPNFVWKNIFFSIFVPFLYGKKNSEYFKLFHLLFQFQIHWNINFLFKKRYTIVEEKTKRNKSFSTILKNYVINCFKHEKIMKSRKFPIFQLISYLIIIEKGSYLWFNFITKLSLSNFEKWKFSSTRERQIFLLNLLRKYLMK